MQSRTNRNASTKFVFPDPFGPTRKFNGPKRTSQCAMLLKFRISTRFRNVESYLVTVQVVEAVFSNDGADWALRCDRIAALR
jgi:hypothetical protein